MSVHGFEVYLKICALSRVPTKILFQRASFLAVRKLSKFEKEGNPKRKYRLPPLAFLPSFIFKRGILREQECLASSRRRSDNVYIVSAIVHSFTNKALEITIMHIIFQLLCSLYPRMSSGSVVRMVVLRS